MFPRGTREWPETHVVEGCVSPAVTPRKRPGKDGHTRTPIHNTCSVYCVCSSVAERCRDKAEVVGANPSRRTMNSFSIVSRRTMRVQESYVATVTLARNLNIPPTDEEQTTIRDLVKATDKIIIDASETVMMDFQWVRFLCDMTAVAEEKLSELFIVGAGDQVRRVIDLIGQTPFLRLRDSISEIS